jgi:hypothetical protein
MLLLAVMLAARVDGAIETGGQVRDADAARMAFVTPSLSALVAEPGLELDARYAPRLWLGDAEGIRHDALLALKWRQTPRLSWTASERFRYGRSELVWDPGTAKPFDFLETLLPVVPDELSTDAEAGFSYQATRNVSLYGAAGYAAYGGLSATSQQILPLQQGPQTYFGVDQELTRSDRLSTAFYGSHTQVSGDRRNSLLEVTEGWRHELAPRTSTRISAGVSASRRVPQDGDWSLFPVTSASIDHDLVERSQRLELRALAALGPHQSRLTGDLVERAELGASARWLLGETFSLRARAAGAQELAAARLLLTAIDASFRVKPDITWTAGAEALWQRLPGQTTDAHLAAFAALSVGVRDLL